MELEHDWSGLPLDLLWEIACHLGSAKNLFAFRGVCTNWRYVSSYRKVIFLKQRVPLLMLAENEDSAYSVLYSPYEKRILMRLILPELRDKRVIEVKFGWLLTLTDSGEVTLLNPLTRVQIHLPNYTTFPNYERYTVHPCYNFIESAVLSENPSDDLSKFVLFVRVNAMLGYWRAGDKNWTTLPSNPYATVYIEFYNNMLYMVHEEKNNQLNVTILDIHGTGDDSKVNLEVNYRFKACANCSHYLVESSQGGLLLISRYCDSEENEDSEEENKMYYYETHNFVVMCINVMKGEWVVKDNLENDAIFIGWSGAISIPAANFLDDTIKPNCIYFTDDYCDCFYTKGEKGIVHKDMGIFNMEDKTIERFNIDSNNKIFSPIWIDSSIIR